MLTIILIHVQRGRAYGIRPRFLFVPFMFSAWKESHRRESDSWPLPYQGSALPLSYCGLFLSHSLFLSTLLFRSGVLAFVPLSALVWSGRRGSNPPPIAWKAIALPNELLPLLSRLWGRVDSNHWTPKRTDLQSVAIATMRLPHFSVSMLSFLFAGELIEPMKGLEPPTGWLQISYSTNWVTSASVNLSNNSFSRQLRLQKYYFFQIPQKIFSNFFLFSIQTTDFLKSTSEYFFLPSLLRPHKTPPCPTLQTQKSSFFYSKNRKNSQNQHNILYINNKTKYRPIFPSLPILPSPERDTNRTSALPSPCQLPTNSYRGRSW